MTVRSESYNTADSTVLGPDLTWDKFHYALTGGGSDPGAGPDDGDVSGNAFGVYGGDRTGIAATPNDGLCFARAQETVGATRVFVEHVITAKDALLFNRWYQFAWCDPAQNPATGLVVGGPLNLTGVGARWEWRGDLNTWRVDVYLTDSAGVDAAPGGNDVTPGTPQINDVLRLEVRPTGNHNEDLYSAGPALARATLNGVLLAFDTPFDPTAPPSGVSAITPTDSVGCGLHAFDVGIMGSTGFNANTVKADTFRAGICCDVVDDLAADGSTPGQITLTWSTPDDGDETITGYRIYRGLDVADYFPETTDGAPYNNLVDVGLVNEYVDATVTPGTAYHYAISVLT